MSAELLLNALRDGAIHQGANYNQKLSNNKSIFEEFLDTAQQNSIIACLKRFSDLGGDIELNLSAITLEGRSIFSVLMNKLFGRIELPEIIQHIFVIQQNQEQELDWNQPIFMFGNSLALECAKHGQSEALAKLLSFRGKDFLPVINVNQQNTEIIEGFLEGKRIIDYCKECLIMLMLLILLVLIQLLFITQSST
ncbi:MAG UNVERIFIED_CONTAM: hypothetical protein LVQ98_04470 [Rickettsiaceae bacterium]|jgi:hypothetical protein